MAGQEAAISPGLALLPALVSFPLFLSFSSLSLCTFPFRFFPSLFCLHCFFPFILLILFCPRLLTLSLVFFLSPSLSIPKWVSTSLSPTSSPSFGFIPPPVQGAVVKSVHVPELVPCSTAGGRKSPSAPCERLTSPPQLFQRKGTDLE